MSIGWRNARCHGGDQQSGFGVTDERTDSGSEACCNRGRHWDVRRIRTSYVLENSAVGTVTAIGRKKLGGISQAKLKSSYVETSRTAPAGRGALGTGRCSLLPWYLYGDSVGGGAPEDNRGLHHRVARVLRNTAVLTQASHS
jgi:hypothetical protein